MSLARADLLSTLRVALGLSALVAVVSLFVHLAAAEEARGLLGFTFPGVPDRLGEAVAIFANNARIMLGAVIAGMVSQAAIRAEADGVARGAMGALVRFCDVVLLVWCVVQVVIVGAALGAYGGQLFWPILAHLPFELAAFSLVLALYLKARRERLQAQALLKVGAVAALLLALGAVVEVYA